MGAVVSRGALVKSVEVKGMLEGAVFNQGAFWDVSVVLCQAHNEPQTDLGVGIEFAGAEFDDVAEAFGGAMFAVDTVIRGRATDKRELEVNLVVNFLHGRKDKLAKCILSIISKMSVWWVSSG